MSASEILSRRGSLGDLRVLTGSHWSHMGDWDCPGRAGDRHLVILVLEWANEWQEQQKRLTGVIEEVEGKAVEWLHKVKEGTFEGGGNCHHKCYGEFKKIKSWLNPGSAAYLLVALFITVCCITKYPIVWCHRITEGMFGSCGLDRAQWEWLISLPALGHISWGGSVGGGRIHSQVAHSGWQVSAGFLLETQLGL